jgi:hypothetical protein
MYMSKSKTSTQPKPTFREWYEKKYGKLPLYLENAQKLARKNEYLKEVGYDKS